MKQDFPDIRCGPRNDICDVRGITVGATHDENIRTGVTIVIPEQAAIVACTIAGGAPGTRETDALRVENLVQRGDGVVLAGGSVFGLESASTLTHLLAADGRGFKTAAAKPSPIVPAAILFDMANGGNKDWGDTSPYTDLTRAAYKARGDEVRQGNAGAGYGAMAGRLKGGQGSASAQIGDGIMVAALVAANPLGAVVDANGCFFAQPLALHHDGALEFGLTAKAGEAAQIGAIHPLADSKMAAAIQNTSIGVVAVEADLSVDEAQRVAIMAQDGLARAIRPIHTPFDGDALFVLATGHRPLADNLDMRPVALTILGALAADCVSRAVAAAVWQAETLGDMIAYRDRFK